MTDYFSTNPTKVTPGQPIEICYDFTSAGISGPISVTADYGGSGGANDEVFSLSATNPCKTITPPSGITTMILVDSSGTSEDHAVPLT